MAEQTWKWKHFDKRTSDRYVEKGIITRAEVDSHLKSLPDETANATWVELELEETELVDYLDEEEEDTFSDEEEVSEDAASDVAEEP